MTTEPRLEELLDLALGLLEPAEARALEAHAAACVACRAELASLRRTHRLVAGLPPLEAPERGAAILLAAGRKAADLAAARSPRWWVPRWLAGGALGLAGAAALALLVLRVEGPPTRGPLSDDRDALLGRAAPALAPAPSPARVVADRVELDRPTAEAAPAKKAEAVAATTEQAAGSGALLAAGERRKEARAALAVGPSRASRAAAFAGNAADGERPPCRLEQRRRLLRDEEGRVVGRVREGRYPTDGVEVALRVEERFSAAGRLLGGTVRAGDRLFTVGTQELAEGRVEPLPGVRLAASAAEAELAEPRCEP